MCALFRNILELRGLPLKYELVPRKRVIMLPVINIVWGRGFLPWHFQQNFLLKDFGPVAPLDYGGGIGVHVICNIFKDNHSVCPPLPLVELASLSLYQQRQKCMHSVGAIILDSRFLQIGLRKKY